MTTAFRSSLETRLRATITDEERRIPVVLGLCGAGRTTLLRHLHADLGADGCQYVNVERTATTPERFLRALTVASPFEEAHSTPLPSTPREAFDAVLGFFSGARRGDGGPATFLLDEVLEFRTFESFPGLRRALSETLAVLASSPNRFVLTSRYVTRAERALSNAAGAYFVAPLSPLSRQDVEAMIAARSVPGNSTTPAPTPPSVLAESIVRLSAGRAAYAHAIVETMTACGGPGATDPVSALAAAIGTDGRLAASCAHCYELRLHRARGYGALKAILEILAVEEPLTLTQISQQLGRTPGSTKDYLTWLEDVDLVSVQKKRYRFRDPLLRLWVRLHCRAEETTAETVSREIQGYVASCAAAAMA